MSSNKPFFFDIFSYDNMATDYIDRGIVFEHNIIITKDIYTATGSILIGQKYEQVNWYLDRAEFHFINWKKVSDWEMIPHKSSVRILQSEIAVLLNWTTDGKTTPSKICPRYF